MKHKLAKLYHATPILPLTKMCHDFVIKQASIWNEFDLALGILEIRIYVYIISISKTLPFFAILLCSEN